MDLLFFGAFLVFTAIRLARDTDHSDDADNAGGAPTKTYLNTTDSWHGLKLYVKRGRNRVMTPMFLVIVALATTDLLFAFDSIPAIYGLTSEPNLVFTANVFALMGLRQLYFLLGICSTGWFTCPRAGVHPVLHRGQVAAARPCTRTRCPFINGGQPLHVVEIPTLLRVWR